MATEAEQNSEAVPPPAAPVSTRRNSTGGRRGSNRERRSSISAEGGWDPAATDENLSSKLTLVPKGPEVEERLIKCFQSVIFFSGVGPKTLKLLIETLTEVTVAAGETVINQGDEGKTFYIVESGTLECYRAFSEEDAYDGCTEKPSHSQGFFTFASFLASAW